jgi:hypothetical protein
MSECAELYCLFKLKKHFIQSDQKKEREKKRKYLLYFNKTI